MSGWLSRTELLLGAEALQRLRTAHVAVVGLGAVGSYAVEALARAGVGKLRLVDFDEIRASNINRQLTALHSTLGRPKADVARERVLQINPDCQVEALRVFAEPPHRQTILQGPPDVLIDAIDSVGPKVGLLLDAVRGGVPLIIACMGAAERLDATAVCVGDLFTTKECPLARFARRRLRRAGVHEGIRCIYSVESVRSRPKHDRQRSVDLPHEQDVERRGRLRRVLGSLPTVPGMFGLLAAHEAICALISTADARSCADHGAEA